MERAPVLAILLEGFLGWAALTQPDQERGSSFPGDTPGNPAGLSSSRRGLLRMAGSQLTRPLHSRRSLRIRQGGPGRGRRKRLGANPSSPPLEKGDVSVTMSRAQQIWLPMIHPGKDAS